MIGQQPKLSTSLEPKGPENNTQIINLRQSLGVILLERGIKKDEVRKRVTEALKKSKVPFTGFDVEEDEQDDKKNGFYSLRVYVPHSWPSDDGQEGQYFITFSVPDIKY